MKAGVRNVIGTAYSKLSQNEKAIAHLTDALRLREDSADTLAGGAATGAVPGMPAHHPILEQRRVQLGQSLPVTLRQLLRTTMAWSLLAVENTINAFVLVGGRGGVQVIAHDVPTGNGINSYPEAALFQWIL